MNEHTNFFLKLLCTACLQWVRLCAASPWGLTAIFPTRSQGSSGRAGFWTPGAGSELLGNTGGAAKQQRWGEGRDDWLFLSHTHTGWRCRRHHFFSCRGVSSLHSGFPMTKWTGSFHYPALNPGPPLPSPHPLSPPPPPPLLALDPPHQLDACHSPSRNENTSLALRGLPSSWGMKTLVRCNLRAPGRWMKCITTIV